MTEFRLGMSRGGVRIQTGYLLAGIVVGVLWFANGDESPWEHALRLVVLMAAVMSVVTIVRRWMVCRGRSAPHHSVGRFLLLKLVLLGAAVVAGMALRESIPNSDLWIGLGLGVVVTVIGPILHPWLMRPARTGSGTDTAAPATV